MSDPGSGGLGNFLRSISQKKGKAIAPADLAEENPSAQASFVEPSQYVEQNLDAQYQGDPVYPDQGQQNQYYDEQQYQAQQDQDQYQYQQPYDQQYDQAWHGQYVDQEQGQNQLNELVSDPYQPLDNAMQDNNQQWADQNNLNQPLGDDGQWDQPASEPVTLPADAQEDQTRHPGIMSGEFPGHLDDAAQPHTPSHRRFGSDSSSEYRREAVQATATKPKKVLFQLDDGIHGREEETPRITEQQQQPQDDQTAPEQMEEAPAAYIADSVEAEFEQKVSEGDPEVPAAAVEPVADDSERPEDLAMEFFSDLYLPSLSRPDGFMREKLREIEELKRELELSEVDVEWSKQGETLEEESLMLGKLSLEEVYHKEMELQMARIKEIQEETKRKMKRNDLIKVEEERIRREIMSTHGSMRVELREMENSLQEKATIKVKEEQEAFRRAEDQLRDELQTIGGKMSVEMVDLTGNQEKNNFDHAISGNSLRGALRSENAGEFDMYAAVRGRRYQVQWDHAPRLVRIRIDYLRALKNKLAPGNYHMMVSLYDRLGGSPLKWTQKPVEKGSGISYTGCTVLPQPHGGKFYHLELSFSQRANRIFLALPPELLTRPSFVFVFELFQCGVSTSSASTTVKASLKHFGAEGAQGRTLGAQGLSGFDRLPTAIAGLQRLATGVQRAPTGFGGSLAAPSVERAKTGSGNALMRLSTAIGNGISKVLGSDDQTQQAGVNAGDSAPSESQSTSDDRVVGWGAIPIQDSHFRLLNGKYLLPLLRGPMDLSIDKFEEIDRQIKANLDCWLCNCYFDIRCWPVNRDYQREFAVEMKFQGEEVPEDEEERENRIKIRKIRNRKEKENKKRENFVVSKKQARANGEEASREKERERQQAREAVKRTVAEIRKAENLERRKKLAKRKGDKMREEEKEIDNEIGQSDDEDSQSPSGSESDSSSGSDADGYRRVLIDPEEKQNQYKLHQMSTSGHRELVVQVKTRQKNGKLKEYPDKAEGENELNPASNTMKSAKKRAEILRNYQFALSDGDAANPSDGPAAPLLDPFSAAFASSMDAIYRYKIRYLTSELSADLGLSNWRSFSFWLTLLMLIATWFLRIPTHYLGQYLFLQSAKIPIIDFSCRIHYCTLDYPDHPQSLQPWKQVLLVIFGPLTNIFIYSGMLFFAKQAQTALKSVPTLLSRFLLCFGLNTLFDPFSILFVDCARHHWTGDAFKMYQYFAILEGSGVIGVFITIVSYAVLCGFSLVLFYQYMLRVHMNGRLLDIHRRLFSPAASFVLPNDMEISVTTLRWILTKAKRWTGMNGQKRKIMIHTYHVMENGAINRLQGQKTQRQPGKLASERDLFSSVAPNSEKLIHLSIFTQTLTGELELYRHFVRNPDGSICELFDSFELPGEREFQLLESQLLEQYRMESLSQLSFSLNQALPAGGRGKAIAGVVARQMMGKKHSPNPSITGPPGLAMSFPAPGPSPSASFRRANELIAIHEDDYEQE